MVWKITNSVGCLVWLSFSSVQPSDSLIQQGCGVVVVGLDQVIHSRSLQPSRHCSNGAFIHSFIHAATAAHRVTPCWGPCWVSGCSEGSDILLPSRSFCLLRAAGTWQQLITRRHVDADYHPQLHVSSCLSAWGLPSYTRTSFTGARSVPCGFRVPGTGLGV